jgi:hypothetical protein
MTVEDRRLATFLAAVVVLTFVNLRLRRRFPAG